MRKSCCPHNVDGGSFFCFQFSRNDLTLNSLKTTEKQRFLSKFEAEFFSYINYFCTFAKLKPKQN